MRGGATPCGATQCYAEHYTAALWDAPEPLVSGTGAVRSDLDRGSGAMELRCRALRWMALHSDAAHSGTLQGIDALGDAEHGVGIPGR